MHDFPDLSAHGYTIHHELGHNTQGGRLTYRAIQNTTQKFVAIKLFQFGAQSATWTDYKYIEREVNVLRQIDHPMVPNYLDAFECEQGQCLVQEYIEASSLSKNWSFEPEQIKHIAVSVLEILVYLQNRLPPIIHRDIKPSNILHDASGKVYLVDFGLARIGGGHLQSISSVIAGTLGFMPPEQQFNHPLTKASDLFALGVTLICLITGTPENKVTELIDLKTNEFQFTEHVSGLSHTWLRWLTTMVKPDPQERFEDAEEALLTLLPLNILASSIDSAFSQWTGTVSPHAEDASSQSISENLAPPELDQTVSEMILVILDRRNSWMTVLEIAIALNLPPEKVKNQLLALQTFNLILQGRLLDWKIAEQGIRYCHHHHLKQRFRHL